MKMTKQNRRNTKNDEKIMRDAFSKRNSENSEQYLALLFAFNFWKVIDEIKENYKSTVFRYLYLSPKNFANKHIKSSIELNISLKTLERYRNDFVLSFHIVLEFIQKYADSNSLNHLLHMLENPHRLNDTACPNDITQLNAFAH